MDEKQMTDIAELKGAIELFAYSVRALGLISGMNAENQRCMGHVNHTAEDYMTILDECGINYNGIITTMNQYR